MREKYCEMNEFKICDICNGKNIEILRGRLMELDGAANIIVGCHGFCGIGATRLFVIANGIAAIGNDIDETIGKVQEILNR